MSIDNFVVDGKVELSSFDSSIKFEDVSFSYKKSDRILNHIDLTIKKGMKVGLCGHSGGGKEYIDQIDPYIL